MPVCRYCGREIFSISTGMMVMSHGYAPQRPLELRTFHEECWYQVLDLIGSYKSRTLEQEQAEKEGLAVCLCCRKGIPASTKTIFMSWGRMPQIPYGRATFHEDCWNQLLATMQEHGRK